MSKTKQIDSLMAMSVADYTVLILKKLDTYVSEKDTKLTRLIKSGSVELQLGLLSYVKKYNHEDFEYFVLMFELEVEKFEVVDLKFLKGLERFVSSLVNKSLSVKDMGDTVHLMSLVFIWTSSKMYNEGHYMTVKDLRSCLDELPDDLQGRKFMAVLKARMRERIREGCGV